MWTHCDDCDGFCISSILWLFNFWQKQKWDMSYYNLLLLSDGHYCNLATCIILRMESVVAQTGDHAALCLFFSLHSWHYCNVAQYYFGGRVERVIYSLPGQSPPG